MHRVYFNDVKVVIQPQLGLAFCSLDGAHPRVVLAEAVCISVQVDQPSASPRRHKLN